MSKEESIDFLFTWKIKNFNFFSKIYCELLTSPVFRVTNLQDSEWRISIFPRTVSECLECQIKLLSCKNNSRNKMVAVNFRYQLASCNGVILKTSDVFYKTFEEGSCSEVYRLIELYDLIKEILKYPEDTLIFRCYVSDSNFTMPMTSSDSFISGCEAETDISCHSPSFIWRFQFSNINDWLVSKKIILENIPIEIIFKYIDEKIDIELFSDVTDDWTRHFTCDIDLINAIGKSVVSGEGDYEFNNENRIWKFADFISKQHLEQAHCFLREEIRIKLNILHLYSFISKITYSSKDQDIKKSLDVTKYRTALPIQQSSTTPDSDVLFHYSQHSFRNFSIDETSADVKLLVENEVFLAHKSLLADSSSVFSEIFASGLKNDTIDINDMELKTLDNFLEYIYTGMVNEIDVEIALDLSVAAERYQVLPLVNKCCTFLEQNLTVSNVCGVLFIADMNNHTHLKTKALDYIVSNASETLSSSEWAYWIERNIHLATEIFLKLSKKFDSGNKTNNQV